MCSSLKFTLKFPNFSSRAWYGSSRTRVHTCAHVYQARQPITGTLCTVLHNGTCVHVYTTVQHNGTLYAMHCTQYTLNYMRHKSARIGDILNPCHISKFSAPQCHQNDCYVEVSLRSQVTKVPWSPYQLTPPGWLGRSIPGGGYSRNIQFWGNFEANLHIFNI